MKFILEIELGNEGMRTGGDMARILGVLESYYRIYEDYSVDPVSPSKIYFQNLRCTQKPGRQMGGDRELI